MPIPTNMDVYQQTISADTLYYIKADTLGRSERIQSGLSVTGGQVNVYGSVQKPTTPLTDMYQSRVNFEGLDWFEWIPTYIYFETVSGVPVIDVSSVLVEEVV